MQTAHQVKMYKFPLVQRLLAESNRLAVFSRPKRPSERLCNGHTSRRCAFKASGLSGDGGRHSQLSWARRREEPECVLSWEASGERRSGGQQREERGERDPVKRGHGGEMGTRQRHRVGDREPWQQGPFNCSLASALYGCVTASKCGAGLTRSRRRVCVATTEAHTHTQKAQRIKCCVTLRKRNSVLMRTRAPDFLYVSVCTPHNCVCGLICFYLYVCQFELAVWESNSAVATKWK